MTAKERQKELGFKIYVTDSLKFINESVVKLNGGNAMKKRFVELIENKSEGKEQSADEVIARISNKLDRMAEK